MNDFLQSIRNQSKDKRYQQNNRPRRPYDNNGNGNHHHSQQQQHHNNQQHTSGNYHHHRNNDNRNHDNHRNKYHNQRPRQDHMLRDESLALIKDVLEAMATNQAQALEIKERRAIAEERKAEAIEEIAGIISSLAGAEFPAMEKVVSGIDAVAREFEEDLNLEAKEDYFASEPEAAHDSSMDKEEILDLIQKMRSEGSTYNEVAAHLTELGLPTFSGRGKWHAQTIHRLCQ